MTKQERICRGICDCFCGRWANDLACRRCGCSLRHLPSRHRLDILQPSLLGLLPHKQLQTSCWRHNKLRTDNSQHGMRLTVRGLGGAVCFLRADLTGRAPYMPFKSRVARCRVSGSHRNPGLIPLTRTGLPTWQNCCWKILQEHKGSEQRHAVQLSMDMLKCRADFNCCVKLFTRLGNLKQLI